MDKLEKILSTTKEAKYWGGSKMKSILDEDRQIKAVFEYYINTDLSLQTLQILVRALQDGIVYSDYSKDYYRFENPYDQACKKGNIEFIKLCEDCPIELEGRSRYRLNEFSGLAMENTKTTKYFLDNLEKYETTFLRFTLTFCYINITNTFWNKEVARMFVTDITELW